MRRADRLFQIVQILRRGRVVTAQAIAEQLEVSERTVYRDLQDLSARGVPLLAEAGVGYQLDKGFDMPPLMFNSQEVEALVIAARMLDAWADPETKSQIQSALEKIEQVLPAKLQEKPARVRVFAPGFMTQPTIWQALPDLRQAIDSRHKFTFHYRDQQQQTSQRTIRPLAIYFWGRAWTCVGWCELRAAFRHFRLDRMSKWQKTAETFADEAGKTLADFEATLDK
ncbi:YafY family protein [Halioxenophilus sp. WMMB6]|uniref:helix-turn-helix transcriptional regulator n=1 Tax=Halioxenophilus sp. WMMB6 TaxID=3073815 RepID=UPI00295F077B|nr:YafY family protein [Halioxenophilus sp. WMMB6]